MNAVFQNSAIRRATLADIEPILELGKERYPGRGVEAASAWLKWHIENPNSLVLIGRATAGVASIIYRYGFEKKARCDALESFAPEDAATGALLLEVLDIAARKAERRKNRSDRALLTWCVAVARIYRKVYMSDDLPGCRTALRALIESMPA